MTRSREKNLSAVNSKAHCWNHVLYFLLEFHSSGYGFLWTTKELCKHLVFPPSPPRKHLYCNEVTAMKSLHSFLFDTINLLRLDLFLAYYTSTNLFFFPIEPQAPGTDFDICSRAGFLHFSLLCPQSNCRKLLCHSITWCFIWTNLEDETPHKWLLNLYL